MLVLRAEQAREHQVARRPNHSKRLVGPIEDSGQRECVHWIGLGDDGAAVRFSLVDPLDDERPRRGDSRSPADIQGHARDLLAREADERVAVAERVVDEGERVLARESDEPEREAREVHGERIPVNAVQAALRDEPSCVEERILVRRQCGHGRGPFPGPDQVLGELTARLDEEGTGAHRGIADLERQDVVGRHPVVEKRRQRAIDHDLGDCPRSVVGAEPPALLTGLEEERSRRDGVRLSRRDTGRERSAEVLDPGRCGDGFRDLPFKLQPRLVRRGKPRRAAHRERARLSRSTTTSSG